MANRPRAGRLTREDRIEETERLRGQGLTHREIAERLDVSVSTVADDLRSSRTEARTAGRSSWEDEQAAAEQSYGSTGRLLGSMRALVRAARRRLP
jgi:IS30 family transposase